MSSEPEFARPRGEQPDSGVALRLRLLLKNQPIQSFRFDQEAITLGRDPYCDIYVDNPGVSRQHLRIERTEADEFRVRDLQSANGTFLNQQPVQIAALRDGDAIQFGKYTLEIAIERIPRDARAARPAERAAGGGATVMFSPTEMRRLMAETKPAEPRPAEPRPPDLRRVTAGDDSPEVMPAPAARRGTTWWLGALAGLALLALAAWWWRAR